MNDRQRILRFIHFIILLMWISVLGITQPLSEMLSLLKDQNLELRAMYTDYQGTLEKVSQVNQLPEPGVVAKGFEVGVG